jgi:Flp pilus assembly protein TadG
MAIDNQTDHDLLVALKTSLDIVIQQQQGLSSAMSTLANRVSILENKDSRDSEKFRTISEEIRRSLNNSERINAQTGEIESLKKSLETTAARNWQIWLLIISLIVSNIGQWILK